jgi:spermidine synthase
MAASFFTDFHPSLDLASGEFTLATLYSVVDAFLWPMLLAFPPALLMGIGFPSLIREGTDTVAILGQSVGRVLFANIIGSALGSLFVGFVMLHSFGTERTLQVLVLTGLAMSFLIFVRAGEPEPGVYGPGAATATVSVVALLCLAFFPAPLKLIAACHLADHPDVRLTVVEDRSGTAALRAQTGIVAFEAERAILGQTRLHIDGALHGLLGDEAQADLAVKLAISAHPGPRRILSIGLGDGRMIAAAAAVRAVREVVVVELKESLRRLIGSTPHGARIEQSGSRLRFVADDGRRWLQANPEERFDLIIMWPLHAAHARSGNLFSQEFFRLLRSRITSDGIVFLRSADPYSTARTAATVFDSVIRLGFQGYFASMHRLRFDPERAGVDPESLTDNLSADRETILRFTEGSPLNSDFRPNGEYYLTYPQARWMRGGAIPHATGSGALAVYVSDRRL